MRTAAIAMLILLPVASMAAAPRHHEVNLGTVHPAGSPDVRVRALMVDGQLKHWTVGELHEVTAHTFTIRSIDRLNDSLPGEAAVSRAAAEHWIWQPGPWLLVDRITGRVTVLHLPDFDAGISDVVWFRDLAAYCGKAPNGRKLVAVVAQVGVHGALVRRPLESVNKVSEVSASNRVCTAIEWQRMPLRVSLTPSGGEPIELSLALNLAGNERTAPAKLPVSNEPALTEQTEKEPIVTPEPGAAMLKSSANPPGSPAPQY